MSRAFVATNVVKEKVFLLLFCIGTHYQILLCVCAHTDPKRLEFYYNRQQKYRDKSYHSIKLLMFIHYCQTLHRRSSTHPKSLSIIIF